MKSLPQIRHDNSAACLASARAARGKSKVPQKPRLTGKVLRGLKLMTSVFERELDTEFSGIASADFDEDELEELKRALEWVDVIDHWRKEQKRQRKGG